MTRCVEKDLNLHSSCEQQFYRLLAWPIGVQRLKIFGKYVTKKDGKADGQTYLGTKMPSDDSKIGFFPTRQSSVRNQSLLFVLLSVKSLFNCQISKKTKGATTS